MIKAQPSIKPISLMYNVINFTMESQCIECSFCTEEPGELYTHFMDVHNKLTIKTEKNPSYSLDSFAG